MDGFCAGKVFYLKAVYKDLVSCLPVKPKLRVGQVTRYAKKGQVADIYAPVFLLINIMCDICYDKVTTNPASSYNPQVRDRFCLHGFLCHLWYTT